MASKPTQRCIETLKELGFTYQVVERFCVYSKRRIDLFGCIDILGCRDGIGIIGIQACAGSSHATRRAKACAEPRLKTWVESGGRFEVWSWSKRGERGKRKLWTLRRDEVVVDEVAG
jgi:hypothetical protein